MGLRMCRGGLCSDGSLPETVCRGSPLGGAKMTLSLRYRHEQTVKRSVIATIRAQTLRSFIITREPSLLLVALPCDSWLQSCNTLTLQHRIQAPRVGAPAIRDAVDATPLVTPLTTGEFRESWREAGS